MNQPQAADGRIQLHADHDTLRRLGNWTESSRFGVRARYSSVLLDLRTPQIAGDPDVALDLDHATLILLLPDEMDVDQTQLAWTGRGKVHDHPVTGAGRTTRLTGAIRSGEVRIHRGGTATLTAMATREYLDDVRRAHRDGDSPNIDQPDRTAPSSQPATTDDESEGLR